MVRPPLVGQASSSSNESRQSLSSGAEDIQEDRNISPFPRNTSERYSESGLNLEDYYTDLPNHPSHYLSNRDDYISAKPPEGSSDHSLISINTAEPSSDGGPRISSPASSVTSGRPLEWDSGADVGYQQNYAESAQRLDPVLSTIERLAIAQGTAALLTRSDPEGTTEPNSQPTKKTVVKLKKISNESESVGLPNAHSTPFSMFIPNNEGNIGGCDMFSPINQFNSQTSVSAAHQCPPNEEGPTHYNKSSNRYPLFPEVKQVTLHDLNLKDNEKFVQEIPNVESKRSFRSSTSTSHHSPKKNPNSPGKSVSRATSPMLTDKYLKSSKHFESDERNIGHYSKKLSSSLEDIRDLDNLVVGSVAQPNTLPRSQSQNNINSDKDDKLCSNVEIKHQSVNMVMHGFPFTTNKSASSSSVATVVQKNSPLHFPKSLQTSLLKQSGGVQACEHKISDQTAVSTGLVSSETRSSYFTQKLYDSDHNQNNAVVESTELHLDQCHKGMVCNGAHKKLSSGLENSENLNRMADLLDNKRNQKPPVYQFPENIRYQESTLESIESSSKSRGFSTDRQGSMGAEDRVNSFEYLPGYVYETGKQLSSNSTSSASAAHNIENLWDTEGSINLTRDINRGVEIIKDVVRSKSTSDNEMKKKVIQLVVEKLINTNYSEDEIKGANINGNVPWVPPVLENRNDIKFRRQDKSKVPGELSSFTDTSKGTSNASSECFKPKPPGILRDIDTTKLHLIDKCIGTGESLTSTSQKGYTSTQTNSSINSVDGTKPQILLKENKEYLLGSSSTSSSKYDKRNWKEPVTKAEQLYEQKRKMQKEKKMDGLESKKVIQFLDLEKKTQLMRIDIEMEHLNNLRKLLSQTEELKENMKALRKSKAHVLKPSQEESVMKHSFNYQTQPSYERIDRRKTASRPSLSSWLNKNMTTIGGKQEIKNDWSSHHYLSEDHEPRPRFEKSRQDSKLYNFEFKHKNGSEKRDKPINSELKTTKSKHRHTVQPEYSLKCSKNTDSEDSSHLSTNILRGRNFQNDLVHSVGVQTSKISEQNSGVEDKIIKCECHNVCRCCKENRLCSKEKDAKQPVGYYITFQNVPKLDKTTSKKTSLEEVRIPITASKLKTSESNQKIKERKKEVTGSSSESDGCENLIKVQSHRPTLQDYLNTNRPDYVHRADDRKQCIAQLAYLRELRDQSKRRLLALCQPSIPRELPPPPLAVKRVFSQKKMRRQTERKYKQLAEVQNKQQDTKRKEAYRTNRLMAEVFTKKLQRRVLKGETNLSNSVSVISTL